MPPKAARRRLEKAAKKEALPPAEAVVAELPAAVVEDVPPPAKKARAKKAAKAKAIDVPVLADEDDEAPMLASTAPVDADVVLDDESGESDVEMLPQDELAADDENFFGGAVQLGTRQPADLESDSSEDEAVMNRVGDVPMEWYEDEEHIGYDVEGKKVMKPSQSALDKLLAATDDPDMLRSIIDPMTGEKKVLSNADLQLIFNLQRNRVPNPEHTSLYDDWESNGVEFDRLNHPLAGAAGPSKKTFVPKLHEMKKLEKMVRRMLKEDDDKALLPTPVEEETNEPYMLWDDTPVDMDAKARFRKEHSIPKGKVAPPGTYESYRPPPEYLPSEKAKQRWERLRKIDRKEHFQAQQFSCLRHVPFYNHFIQDRYQRCLDLAFFPRMQRTRLVVDPKKLLPDLPSPKDLRPFPERLSFLYKGHTATVRSLTLTPNGQYLATGCDDHMVRVYEVHTGRLMKRYDVGAPVSQVAFSPSPMLNVLAVAVEFSIVFFVPPFCAHKAVCEHSIRFLRAPGSAPLTEGRNVGGVESAGGRGITQAVIDADETAHQPVADLDDEAEKKKRAEFVEGTAKERAAGIVVKVVMHARVKRLTFHGKGDYMCALCPKDHVKYRQTIMLQLSTRKVFCPFRKFAEVVTDCAFHPTEPQFFVSTTNSVRCYNLMAHKLQKRYKAQGGLTTCIAVHPGGDNFLVGDTTHHAAWYDCDFSEKPYKRMKSHRGVVNAVQYHRNAAAYPLFASGSSDGQVHVFHGMVYDDYTKNALIVPVKILKHQRPVYDVCWHPTLPWVFTSTEDGTVSCWTE